MCHIVHQVSICVQIKICALHVHEAGVLSNSIIVSSCSAAAVANHQHALDLRIMMIPEGDLVWANVVAIFRPIDFFHDEDRVRREKELPFIWEVTVLHKIDMTAAVLLVNCPTNVQLDFELHEMYPSKKSCEK